MTWQSRLKPDELEELNRAQKLRDEKLSAYNATRSKLKERAKARIRREKERENEAHQ